jgi:hypothetical protein
MASVVQAFMVVGLAVLASGCALGRSVLDVQVPIPPNAASGVEVKVTRVTENLRAQALGRLDPVPSGRGHQQQGHHGPGHCPETQRLWSGPG